MIYIATLHVYSTTLIHAVSNTGRGLDASFHHPLPLFTQLGSPAQPSLDWAGLPDQAGQPSPAETSSSPASPVVWPAQPAQSGCLAQPSQGAGQKSYMVSPTLDWVKKAGFETKMDIKLTVVLPFDLTMAADILTFSAFQIVEDSSRSKPHDVPP